MRSVRRTRPDLEEESVKKRAHVIVAIAIAAVTVFGIGAVASASGGSGSGGGSIREALTGFEEVPALSTTGNGEFRASVNRRGQQIDYTLTFGSLESLVTQAHIHFENPTNNGLIVVFLCSNLGNGPAGTQACPAGGGTIGGTIRPVDVGAGAAAQGIAAGEFDEFVKAINAGSTYVNVHTGVRTGGEIRAQLNESGRRN
jgi:hypothetical protein